MPESHLDAARIAAIRDDVLSPLAPFRSSVFRMLWTTWLMANVCMWMSDVVAAWMMTSLTTTPLWVALVQTAASLPMFLLGLPSGTFADILDRRLYFRLCRSSGVRPKRVASLAWRSNCQTVKLISCRQG